MTYALAGGTEVPAVACGYKRGWPGQIQSRKMAGRFKITKLRTYIASQRSYTDETPSTSAPRVLYTNEVL